MLKITASVDSRGTRQAGKVVWRYLRSFVPAQGGAVGLEAERRRLSLCFLGESKWGVPLSRSKQREIGKTHRLPHFSQDGAFCSSTVIWKRQTCRSSRQAASDQLNGWGVQEALLCPAQNHSPSPGCVLTRLPGSAKNPPNSGQPNRFPYIGKHALHSWWKKLTRNPGNLVNSTHARLAQSQSACVGFGCSTKGFERFN